MFKAYACVPGETAVEITQEEVANRLQDGKSQLWIDLSASLEEYQAFLKDVMHIHPLAIEDLSHPRMLPKIEEYEGYIFLIMHDIILSDKAGEDRVQTHELYIFLGKNFVVTARRHRIRAADAYQGELQTLSHLFVNGAEAVGHAILRRMIDSFFPMLDRVEGRLDAAEDVIFKIPTPKDLQNIFTLRKDVMKLRSIATQQLDVVNRMAIGEFAILSPHGLLLARDLYDHLYRLAENTAGFRDLIMGLLDAYMSQINNRMNEVMKVLTVIATVMLPLSIVVGFYGMNFKVMPGLDHPYGWIYTTIGMGAIIVLMFAYFKHKKWW
jgi:magnesium transporter